MKPHAEDAKNRSMSAKEMRYTGGAKVCFVDVEKCQSCKEPLSKGLNSLMWCRTPDGNKAAGRTDIPDPLEECCNLICKPCGDKYGGCTEHREPPTDGMMPVYAGYTQKGQ